MDCGCMFTLKDYLEGKVRNIVIPEKSLMSICAEVNVSPNTSFGDLTERQKDLALAWLYVWISGSPMQSGGWNEEDADWKKSTDGEHMSAGILKQYLAMANKIFEKYDLPIVGDDDSWGYVGRGFRNPRTTRR